MSSVRSQNSRANFIGQSSSNNTRADARASTGSAVGRGTPASYINLSPTALKLLDSKDISSAGISLDDHDQRVAGVKVRMEKAEKVRELGDTLMKEGKEFFDEMEIYGDEMYRHVKLQFEIARYEHDKEHLKENQTAYEKLLTTDPVPPVELTGDAKAEAFDLARALGRKARGAVIDPKTNKLYNFREDGSVWVQDADVPSNEDDKKAWLKSLQERIKSGSRTMDAEYAEKADLEKSLAEHNKSMAARREKMSDLQDQIHALMNGDETTETEAEEASSDAEIPNTPAPAQTSAPTDITA
ncbi:MAG: hypothetical protein K9H25_12745 [Rhodospirillum sp.]|nr:hypothetical protein [Rhodospirillum sp.]MCF8490174.1 hypothetical protein [Rhodospirillum sp.]MCF8501219.1 hypothetical protein [Rhodospirillum sp.]